MHCSMASLLAVLASSALALPTATTNHLTRRQANVAAVISNIDAWQTDIANVNTFLDNAAAGLVAPGTVDFVSGAQAVIGDQNGGPPGTASDEPTRLAALTALLAPGDGNAHAASTDLGNVFGGVLTNLAVIVDSDNDVATVQTAVNNINNLRCNEVLPDISELWNGVVLDNPGAPLPPPQTVGPAGCPNPPVAQLPFSGPGSASESSI